LRRTTRPPRLASRQRMPRRERGWGASSSFGRDLAVARRVPLAVDTSLLRPRESLGDGARATAGTMTLVVVSRVDLAEGPGLLVATDSVLSGGSRWPRGPKLFTLGGASVMAFEGDTSLAYPLLTNARNFIEFSDNLCRRDANPGMVFARVRIDVSEAYAQLVAQAPRRHRDARGDAPYCSLILAAVTRHGPVVRTLSPDPRAKPGAPWTMTNITATAQWRQHRAFFAGNGDLNPVAMAWDDLANRPAARLPAYAAFLARVRDARETAVGGTPQVALLQPRRRKILGVRDGAGRRFLLGQPVAGGGHGVDYYQETLDDLTAR
jgi:hypothetical protein